MSPTRASRTRAATTPRAAAANTALKLELPPPELIVVTHKEARVRATREGIVAFAPAGGRRADRDRRGATGPVGLLPTRGAGRAAPEDRQGDHRPELCRGGLPEAAG